MATVKRSKRFDVPADELWSRIGDFHALHTWHPGIAASDRLQGGSVRRLTTADGGTTVETLLEHGTHSYTYRLDSGRLPVEGYVATLRVVGDGDGCVAEWESEFEPTADDAPERVAAVYDAGFDNL